MKRTQRVPKGTALCRVWHSNWGSGAEPMLYWLRLHFLEKFGECSPDGASSDIHYDQPSPLAAEDANKRTQVTGLCLLRGVEILQHCFFLKLHNHHQQYQHYYHRRRLCSALVTVHASSRQALYQRTIKPVGECRGKVYSAGAL